MTAAADGPSRRPDRRGRRRGSGAARRRIAVGTAIAVVVVLAACTPTPAATPIDRSGAAAPGAGAPDPSPDERAIRAVLDALNATAGGPVERQQSVLRGAVDPALLDQLDRCPAATSTLRIEPVYAALRPDPDWQGASGTPAGTVYALPALIRIFTGDRVTGTDLGTIFLGVRDGRALLAPVCVS